MTVEHLVKVCRRRDLKVNADKSEGMMLGGEEGLVCDVLVERTRLMLVSEFKHFGCVFRRNRYRWCQMS